MILCDMPIFENSVYGNAQRSNFWDEWIELRKGKYRACIRFMTLVVTLEAPALEAAVVL
jgi:hypothetical protein